MLRSTHTTNMRHFRKISPPALSLPSCPNWRKRRVANNSNLPNVPTEMEMRQIALDKLKIQRQQSLAQRHVELIRLRQLLMAVSMEELSDSADLDFNQSEPLSNGSLATYGRTRKNHNLSLESLVEFGEEQIGQTFQSSSSFHPHEDPLQTQRTRKLAQIRKELEDFKAIHLQTQQGNMEAHEMGIKNPQGSNFSLVSQDENISYEMRQSIQKMRERELDKLRKQNVILEYQVQRQAQ